jgi:PAS domain S-box-containing protein
MLRNRPQKNDIGRIIVIGAALMVMAYLLDCIINASLAGGGVRRQILFPDSRELAVRLAFLSVLLLFIAYVSNLMLKRKRLETALVKYQAGMDASMDGIFILDGRHECAYVNRSQAGLHGYADHAEALGMSWRIFYGDDEIRRFDEEVFPVILAIGEWRGEAVGRRRDGTTFPQEISFTAIDRSSIVCIVRDITERKRFERELEHKAEELADANRELKHKAEELADANRELEAFSYSLSHDMRNYLTRISCAAQMLRDDHHAAALDENGRYMVNVVCDANEDMDRLIKEMMILSRIIRSEISRETVDLSEVAQEIATVLALTGAGRRAEFAIAPHLVAEGDPQLLKMALENLFNNAWKYTGTIPAARIEFGSIARDGKLAFFVRDNGVGFDMAEADSLFRPFQRLKNAKDFPGSGIGLATVQRIIQRHGGEVWGEGEQGKGATFYFTLPG